MTAYFSVQIEDLQGVYTARTYWIAFAIIMSLSIVCLFFISRLLMRITESLNARMEEVSRWVATKWPRKQRQLEDDLDEFDEK